MTHSGGSGLPVRRGGRGPSPFFVFSTCAAAGRTAALSRGALADIMTVAPARVALNAPPTTILPSRSPRPGPVAAAVPPALAQVPIARRRTRRRGPTRPSRRASCSPGRRHHRRDRRLRQALKLPPWRLDARSNLGAALVGLGRFDEAIEEYRKALETDPGQVAIRFNLGLALYKAGGVDEAAAEFQQVLERDPGQQAALLLLADCQLQLGTTPASSCCSRRGTPTSGRPPIPYLLGTALLRQNETRRGQAVIDRLFSGGETAEGHLLLGIQQMRRTTPERPCRSCSGPPSSTRSCPRVHSLLGVALMNAGERSGRSRRVQAGAADEPQRLPGQPAPRPAAARREPPGRGVRLPDARGAPAAEGPRRDVRRRPHPARPRRARRPPRRRSRQLTAWRPGVRGRARPAGHRLLPARAQGGRRPRAGASSRGSRRSEGRRSWPSEGDTRARPTVSPCGRSTRRSRRSSASPPSPSPRRSAQRPGGAEDGRARRPAAAEAAARKAAAPPPRPSSSPSRSGRRRPTRRRSSTRPSTLYRRP